MFNNNIFGNSYPKFTSGSSSVNLEYSRISEYNFFEPDVVEHISVLTGDKHYPYARNRSSFTIDVLLHLYTSSVDKLEEIYSYINKPVNIYPHSDFSASVDTYGIPIEYYITEFIPYYLDGNAKLDGLILKFQPRKNSVLINTSTSNGWGYNWGTNWGY